MTDLLRELLEALKAETLAWAVWTGLTLLSGLLLGQGWRALARRRWLRDLERAGQGGALALIVRIGGRSDPYPDVCRFLRERALLVDRVLVYEAPDDTNLADPATALRIVEDLYDAIRACGRGELREIHLFYAGMVAYPVALGALLGNQAPVTVYHSAGATYIPLYRLDKQQLHQARLSPPLARLKVRPLPPP